MAGLTNLFGRHNSNGVLVQYGRRKVGLDRVALAVATLGRSPKL